MHLELELIGAEFLDYGHTERIPPQATMCSAKCLQLVSSLAFDVQCRYGQPDGRRNAVEFEVGAAAVQLEVQSGTIKTRKVMLGWLYVAVLVVMVMRLGRVLERHLKQGGL